MSLPGTKAMKNQHPGEDVIRVPDPALFAPAIEYCIRCGS
jgi:hypothetical protein